MLAFLLASSVSASATELWVSPQICGSVAEYRATGVPAGAEVVFVFGAGLAPSADAHGQALAPALQLGVVYADARGEAVLRRRVPDHAPLGAHPFQALIRGRPEAASAVVYSETVPDAADGAVAAR